MTDYLSEIKGRLAKANPTNAEWEALTDPGDQKTAPAWIVDADDLEIRLDATYASGKVAEFLAAAPADITALLNAVKEVRELANYLDTLAPGDQHYAKLIRAAINKHLEGK